MPQHPADIQKLLDRAAIQDLHARYFQGLDQSRPEQVRGCFTEDVVAHYDGRSPLRSSTASATHGANTLIDSLHTFRKKQSGEWMVTTHFMGNLNFNLLEGDAAETETNAIACIVLPGTPPQVLMRSLRYLDKLRRVGAGWRISERQHTLDWSCQVPANFAVTMAERVMGRPASAPGR